MENSYKKPTKTALQIRLGLLFMLVFGYAGGLIAQTVSTTTPFNYGTGDIASNNAPFSNAGGTNITVSGNDVTVTGNVTMTSGTYNFANLTINAGAVVTLSGTTPIIILCTGTFTLNGTIDAKGGTGGVATTLGTPGVGGAGGGGGGAAGGAAGNGTSTQGQPGDYGKGFADFEIRRTATIGTGASISGTSLSFSGQLLGTVVTNVEIRDQAATITAGTIITAGSSSPYTVNNSQTVSATTILSPGKGNWGSGSAIGTAGSTGAGSNYNALSATGTGTRTRTGGGGGSYGTAGAAAASFTATHYNIPSFTYGDAGLTTVIKGTNLLGGSGGGGGGGLHNATSTSRASGSGGGGGGGAFAIIAKNIVISGTGLLTTKGGTSGQGGPTATYSRQGAIGGGGSGGTILLEYQNITAPGTGSYTLTGAGSTIVLNTDSTVTASNGIDISGGGLGSGTGPAGGRGGRGRFLALQDVPACTQPTDQASIQAYTDNNTGTSVTVNWNRGTTPGDAGVIVVAKQGASAPTAPTSGTSYTADAAFGNSGAGYITAAGSHVVYVGNPAGSGSVSVTGLSASTQYTFAVYEYNSTGTCYKTPGSSSNVTTVAAPSCSYPTAQASNITFSNNTSGNGLTVNFDRGNGSSVLVTARLAASNVTPSDGTAYTTNTVFGSGTGTAITGTGNFVVFNGNPTTSGSVAVTGLTPNSNYTFTAYEYNTTGNCYLVPGASASVTATDATAPVISYTPMANTFSTSNRLFSGVTITDAGAGVNTTGGTKPRLFYKKSTDADTYVGNTSGDNGWKYVEATNATTPFSFTLNYSLLQSSVTLGDVIQYFVVAQDLASTPNVQINSGTFNATPASVALTSGAFPIGGSVNSYTITSLSGAVTIGTGGDYTSLTRADGFFNLLNTSTLYGNITATVISDITNEDGTVALNQWTESGAGNYTLTIQSDGSVRSVSGAYSSGALFRINGADRVTFNGGSAAQRNLVFSNTSALTGSIATLSLSNDATNNSFNNCTFRGQIGIVAYGLGSSTGVIVIGTGTSTGNDNITFDRCDISNYTGGCPNNGIYAAGSASYPNDNITISNCNIYNFNNANLPCGINVTGTGNGNNWTISGNSFYSTIASGSSFGGFNSIRFNPGTSSTGNTISGNYIGGTASSCGGSEWYSYSQNVGADNVWTGIYVNVGTGSATNVTNNTIQNFSSTSSTITGIEVAGGTVNVGNGVGTGNLIGGSATTSPYNITASSPVRGVMVSGGTVNVLRNTISGIANRPSTTNISFTGILITGGDVNVGNGAGTGNTIGSTSSTTAISLSTVNTNPAYGIRNTGTGTVLIDRNTVAGMESTHAIVGIQSSNSSGGSATISNNSVYTLTSYDDDYMGTAPASDATKSSTMGVWAEGNNNVSVNNIYGLNNTWSSSTYAYGTTGIYYRPTVASTSVEKNLVHSLNLGGASTSAFMYGIAIGSNTNAAGVTGTVKNNMIRLGLTTTGGNVVDGAVNSAFVIAGIDKWTSAAMNIYNNSVYVGGSAVASNVVNTTAFRRSGAPSSGNDDVRNNIFMNARSNSTTGGNHYATVFNNTTGVTSNYNLYFTPGTGGNLGSYDGGTTAQNTLANLATASGSQEANSITGDPLFTTPAGTSATLNLHVGASSPIGYAGKSIASVTSDYDGDTRYCPADIGADAIKTVDQYSVPSITFAASPAIIDAVCYSASAQSSSLAYSATSQSPTVYSITWGASAISAGFSDVTLASLPVSPISISIPAGAVAATYTGTLTVANTCYTSSSYNISLTVNATNAVSVSIASSDLDNTICSGTSVTFTATPTNGGGSPAYQWKLNGGNVGTNSATYTTSSLANNDAVTVELTSNATCATGSPASSNSIITTVNSTNAVSVSIGSSDADNTICSGTSVTFTATPTNGGGSPAYQWKLNGGNVGTNSATYTTSSLANNDAVTVVITSNIDCPTGSPATSNSISTTVNSCGGGGKTWTGAVSTAWDVPGNWSPSGVPTSSDDVTIPNVANDPAMTTNGSAKAFSISAGATFSISSGQVLSLAGNFTGNGNTISGQGTVLFNGGTAQTITGATTWPMLQINNSSGVSVVSGMQTISLALNLQSGTFTTGGNVTLASNASNTGYIDDFSTGFSGTLSGNVTCKRYFSGSRGYRYISSPINSSAGLNVTAFSADITGANNYIYNPYAPPPEGTFPTCWVYNESNPATNAGIGWESKTAGAIQTMRGYAAVLNPQTISLTGPVNSGNQSINVTFTSSGNASADGFNLVGNPYPSPIGWNAVRSAINSGTNYIAGNVKRWSSSSAYAGQYADWNGTVGTNGATNNIAVGQAFFIQTTSNCSSCSFAVSNAVRVAASNAAFFEEAPASIENSLIRLKVSTNIGADETVVYFDENASDAYDNMFDAPKMFAMEAGLPNIYTKNNEGNFSINVLGAFDTNREIPLEIIAGSAGLHKIEVLELSNFDAYDAIYMEDRLNGTFQNLREEKELMLNLEKGTCSDRCFLHFSKNGITGISNLKKASAYFSIQPNPAAEVVNFKFNPGFIPQNMQVLDALGRVVETLSTNSLSVGHLPNGIYHVAVTSKEGRFVRPFVVAH